jgi:NhaA family Na+:H+ antiporter
MAGTSASRFRRALDHEYSAAISIAAGVLVALLWSALGTASYQRLVNAAWGIHLLREVSLDSTHSVVSSALMTLFFFAIGLELKREFTTGSLTTASVSMPPVFGALGGMMATALLSLLAGFVTHSTVLERGWSVPMATDIAFTLGVLALVGRRLPSKIRVFLLTLAVADDAFSVLILAFTSATHVRFVGVAALPVMVVLGIWTSRSSSNVSWGLAVLVGLWGCLVWANVEPPLAGVIAGLLISFENGAALRLEGAMSRCSTAFVLPVFAVVSCGLRWHELSWRSSTMTIVISLVVIRIVGKVIGISGGVALARLFRFRLDPTITWPLLGGVAILCAIGFTVPLLFAGSLFGTKSASYGAITLGLLAASLVATALGALYLRLLTRD